MIKALIFLKNTALDGRGEKTSRSRSTEHEGVNCLQKSSLEKEVTKQISHSCLGSKVKSNYKIMKVIFLCETSTDSNGSYQNCSAARLTGISIKLE